ncbi:HNH endonuclease signature motif containing protein, partial [Arthrobacter sp. VKM Ac-2550]|uniref:HNH endonuclease signature motif containing protein n=1 Tax=Crystallibacter permensis TaxID=1938888 RepID=UPI0022272AE4
AEDAETGNAHGFSSCAATEIAAALAQPRGSAEKDLAEAAQLSQHLPATVEAMTAGNLDLPRATAIARGSADLPENLLPAFEAKVLPKAGEITVESVQARARKARERLHPETLTIRHERANQSRNVGLVPQDDGMAEVWFRCSADKAVMVFNLVQALAKKLQGPDEARTLPQLRADVITDLLVNNPGTCSGGSAATGTGTCTGTGTGTGAGAGVTASVAVTLSLETAAGLSEEPGELAGYGPIPPEMARNLAGLAKSWLLVLTDEYDKAIAAAKDLRHPPEWLKRLVRLRDGHCSGPGCRVEARFCEVDHTIAWEDGGKTVLENLKAACKPDHISKHAGGWKVTQHPDGSTTWKSRTGHEWTSTPENSWSIRPPTDPPPDLYTPPPF